MNDYKTIETTFIIKYNGKDAFEYIKAYENVINGVYTYWGNYISKVFNYEYTWKILMSDNELNLAWDINNFPNYNEECPQHIKNKINLMELLD